MAPVSRFFVAALLVMGAVVQAAVGPQDARHVYLEGHVVDTRTNEPVRGVVVLANDAQGATANVAAAFLTGPDGRFVFRDLSAGKIGLRTTKTGFLSAEMKPVDLGPGARRDDLRLILKPESTISGRVVDQFGEPVPAASVKAVQFAAVPPNEPANLLPGTSTRTDDAGRYVIGKLDKDLYLVFVEGSAAQAPRAHDQVFFPDSLTADRATVIDVDAGTERAGVDMMVTVNPAPPPSRPMDKMLLNVKNPASVSGMVRDRDGRGVSYVTVALRTPGPSITLRTVTTDESGRFEMDRLPPGRFELVATRDPSNFNGMTAPNLSAAATIELSADQRLTDVMLKFTSEGAIAGKLRDQFGDPTEGILTLRPATDVRGAAYSTGTNARGEFRFANVLPNDYVLVVEDRPFGRDLHVAVGPDAERTMAFGPIYYPGVPDRALATPITIFPGSDLSALDVEVRPEPVTTIEVTIDVGGHSVEELTVSRFALDRPSSHPVTARPLPDELHASLHGTSAGRHRVFVSAREKAENARGRGLAASTDVVSDGVTPSVVTLTLELTARLTAQVVFDKTSAFRALVRVVALRADSPGDFDALRSAPAFRSNGNSTSATAMLAGLPAGRYWIDAVLDSALAESQPNWIPKSMTIGGRDMQNRWLDLSPGQDINDIVITMSDQPTEITGAVTPASPAVSPRAVVLFASDQRLWLPGTNRVRVAAVGPDGRYSFSAVNPGDYRLAPMTSTRLPASAQIPDFLNKLLPVSVPISMKIGERQTVDLIAR